MLTRKAWKKKNEQIDLKLTTPADRDGKAQMLPCAITIRNNCDTWTCLRKLDVPTAGTELIILRTLLIYTIS